MNPTNFRNGPDLSQVNNSCTLLKSQVCLEKVTFIDKLSISQARLVNPPVGIMPEPSGQHKVFGEGTTY